MVRNVFVEMDPIAPSVFLDEFGNGATEFQPREHALNPNRSVPKSNFDSGRIGQVERERDQLAVVPLKETKHTVKIVVRELRARHVNVETSVPTIIGAKTLGTEREDIRDLLFLVFYCAPRHRHRNDLKSVPDCTVFLAHDQTASRVGNFPRH
jgi:hypothetical protein